MMSRKFIDWDLGDHGKNDGNSSIRYPKFISFFVYNNSGYFEQLIIMLELI